MQILKFNMSKITLLYTNDYYSSLLAEQIQVLSGSAIAKKQLLEPGSNSSVDLKQLEGVLNLIDPNNFVLLVVQPAVAEDIWTTASNMVMSRMTAYPWWYFGTDGTTAFDPSNVEGKITESTVAALQGEIGLAPFEGDYSNTSICNKFYQYWQIHGFAGLPATDPNKSRSYVPYLIDTVATFFEVVNILIHSGTEINPSTVLATLNGTGPGPLQFKGCTGVVQIDPSTGSRFVSADQPAIYDLVSLTQDSWESKGRIEDGTFTTLQPLMRPGTYPAPNQEYIAPDPNTPHKKKNGALIAGITVLVASILVVAFALFYFHQKRTKSPTSFFPMLQQ
ncbi:hypothetical protein O6H91_Y186200 [Diphasiastrum complanatum]|nr:hypothetical protein O6H91_Y186200 [Diphasiastrum complanatum]